MINTSTRCIVCCLAALWCLYGCTQTPASQPEYRIAHDTIPVPLVELTASVNTGRQIFVDRDRGHCLLCHKVSSLNAPFQGDLGPDLSAVGRRLSAAQIRLRVVDASIVNPATIMPPYYRRNKLHRVAADYAGETVLDAHQIEHLVAFLVSLNG